MNPVERVREILAARGSLTRAGAADMLVAAALKGVQSNQPRFTPRLVGRVICIVSDLHAAGDEEGLRFFTDALWSGTGPRYQGLTAKGLAAEEFEATLYRLAVRLHGYTRKKALAWHVALFARNWLSSGRCPKRLNDFAAWCQRK